MAHHTFLEVYLVVSAEGQSDHPRQLLSLDGHHWTVKAIAELQNNTETAIDFICVSYIWGPDRTNNPLSAGPRSISTNTLPALLAAMQSTSITAFWIDAFCIPTTQPDRSATLESMGYIYSLAKEVRAVLSESSFHAVKQLSSGDRIDAEAMVTLEVDKWIQSVWTYQEVVNCQQLAFVCSGALGSVVDGSHFLNGIGYSITLHKKEHNIDSFTFRKTFPYLDALEDMIADWMIAGVGERSALAVMSNMDRRVWTEEQNYFYSMMGAITTEPRRRSDIRQYHLAEIFMKICEDKGDFSFIYSSADRSRELSKAWKPQAGLLPAVLSWHCRGESQPGHFDESDSLWLDQVLVFQTAPLSQEAKDHIARWLHQDDLGQANDGRLEELVYSALVGMGFTGSKISIPLTKGLFFPQTSLSPHDLANIDVVVSSTVRWTIGAPGIASHHDENGALCFVPGVFAGIVDKTSIRSIKLG